MRIEMRPGVDGSGGEGTLCESGAELQSRTRSGSVQNEAVVFAAARDPAICCEGTRMKLFDWIGLGIAALAALVLIWIIKGDKI